MMLNRPSHRSRTRYIREITDLPKVWQKKLAQGAAETVSKDLRGDAYYAYLDGRTKQAKLFHRYADVIDASIRAKTKGDQ